MRVFSSLSRNSTQADEVSTSGINWIFCQNGVNIVAGGWSMTAQKILELIQQAKDERAEKLDLSNKNLTEIPPEIAQLTSLQVLYLNNNQIREIPEALAHLTSLQFLNLYNNQIREISNKTKLITQISNNMLS
jgi:Leucine-rich repeat (LRR) protein